MFALGDLAGAPQTRWHLIVFKSASTGLCDAWRLARQPVYDPVGVYVGVAVPDGGRGAGNV